MKKLIIKILFISSVFLGFTQNALAQVIKVDSVKFIEIVPNNLKPGQEPLIVLFNDFITFRCEAFLNKWPPEQQKRVFVWTFLNGKPYSLHNNTTNVGVTCNSLIIPDNSSDPDDCGENDFQLPIKIENFAFGLNEIYVKSWVNFSPDTIISDTLRFVHPKPKVDSVIFNEFIYPDTLMIGDPLANREVYEDNIHFRSKITYNDSLSEGETIHVEVWKIWYKDGVPGEPKLIDQDLLTTVKDSNSLIIPAPNDYFDVPLGYEFGEHTIFMKAWFYLADTIPIDIDTSANLHLFHPKPKVDSVKFINLMPSQLDTCLNHVTEIYNHEIAFKLKTYYNDYLSNEETIKLVLEHTYINSVSGSTQIIRDTISNQTILPIPGDTALIFPPSGIFSFVIDTNDFDYHKFTARAWFELDSVPEIDVIPAKDSLMLTYRKNTAPIIEITTPYDKIYKFPNNNNVLIEGKVTDSTGIVDSVWVKVNGEIFDANVPKQLPPGPFNFSFIIDSLKQPINQIYAWAKDTVPFCPPLPNDTISMLSINTDSTRLIYLKWDSVEKNPPDTLYQVDAELRFHTLPPGGLFSTNPLLTVDQFNEAGIFNPSKINPGKYDVYYTFTTPPSFSENITRSFVIEAGSGIVEGSGRPIDSDVCDESFNTYKLAQSTNSQKINWSVEGGLFTQFNPGKKEIEVRWKDELNYGLLEAVVYNDDISNSYKLSKLFQVDLLQSPDKAYLVQHDSVLFCSLSDTTNYQYQWYKGGDEIITGATKPYYYYGSDINLSYYVMVNYLCENCKQCQTKSYTIKGFNPFCDDCEVNTKVLNIKDGEISETIQNETIVDVDIQNIEGKLLKIIIYDETHAVLIAELRMILKNNSGTLPKSHVFRLTGLSSEIKYSINVKDFE